MLRITDVLIGNLAEDVMQWDDKESFLTGKKKYTLNALRKIPPTFIKILYTYIPLKVIIKKIHGSRIT